MGDESKQSSKVTIDDIYNLLKQVNSNLENKISSVEQEVKTIKTVVGQEINDLKNRVQILEQEKLSLKEKITHIERKSKHNNIIIYGIPEDNENPIDLTEIILEFVNGLLKVELHKIELNNLFRIGKKQQTTRPILVSFISYLKKQEILRNCKHLKGTNISISEDLIEEDRQNRKILIEYLKEAKQQKKRTTIKGNRLKIEETEYTIEDLRNKKHLEKFKNYPSPEITRKASSEPTTPLPNQFLEEDNLFTQPNNIQNQELTSDNQIDNKLQNELSQENKTKKGDKLISERTKKLSSTATPRKNQVTGNRPTTRYQQIK